MRILEMLEIHPTRPSWLVLKLKFIFMCSNRSAPCSREVSRHELSQREKPLQCHRSRCLPYHVGAPKNSCRCVTQHDKVAGSPPTPDCFGLVWSHSRDIRMPFWCPAVEHVKKGPPPSLDRRRQRCVVTRHTRNGGVFWGLGLLHASIVWDLCKAGR